MGRLRMRRAGLRGAVRFDFLIKKYVICLKKNVYFC
jgi:hypothetical protein